MMLYDKIIFVICASGAGCAVAIEWYGAAVTIIMLGIASLAEAIVQHMTGRIT